MQVDELIELCEMLADGLTIEGIVMGNHADTLTDVPDRLIGLLIRFLSGERPTETIHDLSSAIRTADRSTVIPVDPERATLIKDNPVPLRNVADRVDDGGHLILGGDFSGVELP